MRRLIVVILVLSALLLFSAATLFFGPDLVGLPFFGEPYSSSKKAEDSGWSAIVDLTQKTIGRSATNQDKEEFAALAGQITAGLSSDYDKLVAIYDWVTENIYYDLAKAENVSAYGAGARYALDTRSGVCHDFAELTRELLEAVGIEATYERGEVLVSEDKTELHAWNHARVDDRWYALDTTWGSGFFDENSGEYVQKPRRIYLTTPEELDRLHSDPSYKHQLEEEFLFAETALQPVIYLPESEWKLMEMYNQYREAQNLSLLSEERRISGVTRLCAERAAEMICRGEPINLDDLSAELNSRAESMRIRAASMHAIAKWLHHPATYHSAWDQVVTENSPYLSEMRWQSTAVAVVQKGDLFVIVTVFLDYFN